MKLAEVESSRLEAAREPRLDVRDPGLLPEERDCMLLERLGAGRQRGVRARRGKRATLNLLFGSEKHCGCSEHLILLDPLDGLQG